MYSTALRDKIVVPEPYFTDHPDLALINSVLPPKLALARLLDGSQVQDRTDRNGLCTKRILMMEFVKGKSLQKWADEKMAYLKEKIGYKGSVQDLKRELMEGKVQVPKALSMVMGMGKFLMGSRIGKAI